MAMSNATFPNRAQAGRLLAVALGPWRDEDPLVLALPRGGVPVAVPVAEALGAPLDVLIVRKLGAPGNPEFGMGALVEDGTVFLDRNVVAMLQVGDAAVARVTEAERVEARRRVQRYRGGRPLPVLKGRVVILVDDGIATGGTARAAVRAVRRAGAAKVVLAVPVVAAQAAELLESEVDSIVALRAPHGLSAIAEWYDDFSEVSDEQVVQALTRSAAPPRQANIPVHAPETRTGEVP